MSGYSQFNFQNWFGDVPARNFGMPFCACACVSSQMLAVLGVFRVDELIYRIWLKSAGVMSDRDRYEIGLTQ